MRLCWVGPCFGASRSRTNVGEESQRAIEEGRSDEFRGVVSCSKASGSTG